MDLQEFRLEFSVEAEQEKKTTEYKKKKKLLGLLCQLEHQGNIVIINSLGK